jgi:alginate O-acetyltransferase complex protein AlgI
MAGMCKAEVLNGETLYYLRSFLPMLILAAIGSTPLAAGLWKRMDNRMIKLFFLVLGMILCTAYVVASTYNPFLYFRF